MNKHSKKFSEQEINNIFTDICHQNNWQIHMHSYQTIHGAQTQYSVVPFRLTPGELRNNDLVETCSVEDFLKEKSLLSNYKNMSFSLKPDKLFDLLATMLEKTNSDTLKTLNIFAGEKSDFKSWKKIIAITDYQQNSNTRQSFKIFMSHYEAPLSNRELVDIFDKMYKLEFSKEETHQSLTQFCSNHLESILPNIAYKNFICSQVRDIMPSLLNFYQEFLEVEFSKKDLFSPVQTQYKVYHMEKSTLFKDYPLSLSQPTGIDDYFTILDNAVGFLNKKAVLKLIKCSYLQLSGKQKKHQSLILSLETQEGFKPELVQDFIVKVLEDCVALSGEKILNSDNTYSATHSNRVREQVEKTYAQILNYIVLDKSVPEKPNSVKPKKI